MKTNLLFLIIPLLIASCEPAKENILTLGETQGNGYSNDYFGISFNFDQDWSVMSQAELEALASQGQDLIESQNPMLGRVLDLSEKQTVYLFGLSKFTDLEIGEFNPSFILLSENLTFSPLVRSENDYLNSTKNLLLQTNLGYKFNDDLTTKNGFKLMKTSTGIH